MLQYCDFKIVTNAPCTGIGVNQGHTECLELYLAHHSYTLYNQRFNMQINLRPYNHKYIKKTPDFEDSKVTPG